MIELSKLTDRKTWLAPLAGFTDISFREICKFCGADVVVSEMISSDGLTRAKDKSISYAGFTENQRPFGTQLFGSDPLVMAKAVDVILDVKPDFIDINMGCPVKKVIKRGAGSALSKDPKRAAAIVKAMKEAMRGTDLPLSVKIRSGWDGNSINFIEMGKQLEQAGADIIILHARTRNQMYAGHSDWTHIKQLKEAVSIPVIGNGDIRSVDDAETMYNECHCDSVMIGRGSLGQPWVFREILHAENNEIPLFKSQEKFDIIEKHSRLTIEEKGEAIAMKEMRSHFSYYTKGFRGGSKLREFINKHSDPIEILEKIKEIYHG